MGQTAFPYTAIRGLPAKTLAARNTATAGPLQTVSWAAASTGHVLTVQSDGTVAFAAVSAGIGGGTGSVDNAILRADGTGGATLQASGWIIADNYTSSPNATVNHASIQATGSTTNVSVSIVPKGTGAFCLAVPDGTSTGGNARGANAVDLQTARTAANQVASGENAAIIGGQNQRVSNTNSAAVGGQNVVTGDNSAAVGGAATVSGNFAGSVGGQANAVSGANAFAGGGRYSTPSGDRSATIGGEWPRATAQYSVVLGGNECEANGTASVAHGDSAVARLYGMRANSGGRFAATGDAQTVECTLRNKTTTNSAVTLFLDGSSARLTIPSGKILHATIWITGSKSDGTAVASYMRQVTIKNVGGTTSLVGTVNTIGTDEAASTSIAITADDTNDALQINVTGITSETWRWVAVAYGVELAYGT